MPPVYKYMFKVNNKDTRVRFMQVVFTSIRSTQVYYVQTNDSKKYLDQ